MKNLQHLPERFAFKLDEIGKRWIRETFKTNYYDDHDERHFFHYPNFDTDEGFKVGSHSHYCVVEDYTEIPTSYLFSNPQIPTIEKGVMMLVWGDDKEKAVEREVMFFDGNYYVCKHNYGINHIFYKHAKPIPQLPEFTIEEAEKKFNIKIKK